MRGLSIISEPKLFVSGETSPYNNSSPPGITAAENFFRQKNVRPIEHLPGEPCLLAVWHERNDQWNRM